MAEGGFEVQTGERQAPARGRGGGEYRGRGGGDRGRGGRGRGGADGENRGRGGGRGRGGADGDRQRPRTAAPPRLDADGNPIKQKEHKPYEGKPRQEGTHPFDRKSGAGRGRKPEDKKGGHGRFNDGDKEHVAYKKKGAEGEEEVKEEVKPVKVREPSPEMEIIGYTLDEAMAGSTFSKKKDARKAEGIKGAKTQAYDNQKEHQSTIQQNSYAKDTVAVTADVNNVYLGFGSGF